MTTPTRFEDTRAGELKSLLRMMAAPLLVVYVIVLIAGVPAVNTTLALIPMLAAILVPILLMELLWIRRNRT